MFPRWLFKRKRLVMLVAAVGFLFVTYQLFSVSQLGSEMSRQTRQSKLKRNFREYEKADSFVDFKRLFPENPSEIENAESKIDSAVFKEPKSSNDQDNLKKNEDAPIEKGIVKNPLRDMVGIHPHQQNRYTSLSDGTFHCLGTKQRIFFSQVNDDYCDCDDGSDEPSTSACVDNLFYCTFQPDPNKNLVFIKSSKVNDGICDCCDGSDEWKSIQLPEHTIISEQTQERLKSFQSPCKIRCSST